MPPARRRTHRRRTAASARRRLARRSPSSVEARPYAPTGRRRSRSRRARSAGDPRSRTARGRTPSRRCSSTRGLRLHVLLRRDLLADLLKRAANQARHVHLRDADLLCDLRLRQALEEPEVEDLPLALVEDAESRREHGAILRDLVLVLFRADRLERVELLAVLLAAAGRERQGGVG